MLLGTGVDVETFWDWLGHADIQTTHQYLEADVEMKRQALEAAGVTPEPRVRYEPSSAILALLEQRPLCARIDGRPERSP